ncbi:hypothetical protein STAPHY8AQ_70230 [Staphylococcus sp. 8AQ]|nr:hypothetical protein STAPHY8AQ_70230 [Staphylococcus sp. 8AQ]
MSETLSFETKDKRQFLLKNIEIAFFFDSIYTLLSNEYMFY